jgi:hypothetical protein
MMEHFARLFVSVTILQHHESIPYPALSKLDKHTPHDEMSSKCQMSCGRSDMTREWLSRALPLFLSAMSAMYHSERAYSIAREVNLCSIGD